LAKYRNFYFSNGGHLEWSTWLSDTILKPDNLKTFTTGLNLPSGFEREDLVVKGLPWKSSDC